MHFTYRTYLRFIRFSE